MDSKNTLDYALSDLDIKEAVHQFDSRGPNIKDDKIITPNTNIEEVFNNRGHVIMFHAWPKQKVGHWYVILRDKEGNVFLFDSLGHPYTYYNKNYIKFFKNNGIKNIMQNEKVFQHGDSSVCGRYCLVNCVLNKLHLPIEGIYKFYEQEKKKYKTYDNVVLELTK